MRARHGGQPVRDPPGHHLPGGRRVRRGGDARSRAPRGGLLLRLPDGVEPDDRQRCTSRDPELESIAKYQAARFDTQCRIWAPIYRQATLASIAAGYTGSSGADRELAYGDVLEAWREYLAKHNGGRGVVLMGHSQGTGVLRRLLAREIEAHPSQHRRIVGAILLGGNVTVQEGSVIGGDFARTPLCTRRAQVGCVVAYSSFFEDPAADARFGVSRPPAEPNPSGLPGGPGYEIACTDPRPLAGTEGPLRLLVPSEPFAPGPIYAGTVVTSGGAPPSADTTWVSPPDRGEGGCRTINGAHVLRLEPTPGSRRPVFFPEPRWGTHLVDTNLALDELVMLVSQQAARWTTPQVRLRARCWSVALRGRERSFVRSVAFRVGGRTLRDRSAPFRRAVPRAGRRVRAVAKLRQGAAKRLVLRAKRPAC